MLQLATASSWPAAQPVGGARGLCNLDFDLLLDQGWTSGLAQGGLTERLAAIRRAVAMTNLHAIGPRVSTLIRHSLSQLTARSGAAEGPVRYVSRCAITGWPPASSPPYVGFSGSLPSTDERLDWQAAQSGPSQAWLRGGTGGAGLGRGASAGSLTKRRPAHHPVRHSRRAKGPRETLSSLNQGGSMSGVCRPTIGPARPAVGPPCCVTASHSLATLRRVRDALRALGARAREMLRNAV